MPSQGLAKDHKTITVSPSTKWDQVFATLDTFDLATLGGRVGGVGVGGLATGCQYPHVQSGILVLRADSHTKVAFRISLRVLDSHATW